MPSRLLNAATGSRVGVPDGSGSRLGVSVHADVDALHACGTGAWEPFQMFFSTTAYQMSGDSAMTSAGPSVCDAFASCETAWLA